MKLRYWLLLILIGLGAYASYKVLQPPYAVAVDLALVPVFSQVPLGFSHEYHSGKALPFVGSAIIDIDNDGLPEVFLGGGHLQRDGLFTLRNGGNFTDISDDSGLSKDINDASYGAASIDINHDGYVDLLVARDSGVHVFVNQRGFFTQQVLPGTFDPRAAAVGIALGDINLDGEVDLFISYFLKPEYQRGQVFNDPNYGATSRLLLNNGDGKFTDITAAAGLDTASDVFTALFVRLDNDPWPDLVVAQNAGHLLTYRNLGNRQFQNMPNPTSASFGFPMGIAAADYNNDGRIDLFFSNVGSSIPEWMMQGDLNADQQLHKQWGLLRNDGDFQFTDVADAALLANYEFGWGGAFADLNLDGLQDLIVATNYINYPPHWLYKKPGRILIQHWGQFFAPAETLARADHRSYGISPLLADFNADGYLDVIMVNLHGPSVAYFNNGGRGRYLQVDLGDIPEALHAVLSVTTESGRVYHQFVVGQQGLGADQTPIVQFGLGEQAQVQRLEVRYASGRTLVFENPALNQRLVLHQPVPIKMQRDNTATITDPNATATNSGMNALDKQLQTLEAELERLLAE